MSISTLVLILGLASLEFLVRKIKPQITYDEAIAMSRGYWRPSNFAPFTWKANLRYGDFTTNSLGYHSDEFLIEKPPTIYRVLVVGDSFVEGADDFHKAWPYITQTLLREDHNLEVINAGFYGGYSPDSYYAYLKAEGLALKPDLVVLGLYLQNDIADLKPNQWVRTESNGLPLQVVSNWRKVDGQGRQWDGIIPLRYRYPYLYNSHLWVLLANWLDRTAPFLFHPSDEARQLQENNFYNYLTFTDCIYKDEGCLPQLQPEFDKLLFVLTGIDKLLYSQDIPMLLVFETSKWQAKLMSNDSLADDNIYKLQRIISEYFQKNGLSAKLYDLTPEILSGNPIDYYKENDTHWNDRGNELVGQLVSGKIREIIDK